MLTRHRFALWCPLFLVLGLGATGRARSETVWVETGAAIDTVVADTHTVPVADNNPLRPLRAPVPFKGFRYPLVDDAENVTFITDDATMGQEGQHHGIYRSEAATGDLHAVIDPADKIPGTRFSFDCLRGIQAAERGSDFVFNATSSGPGGRGLFVWSAGVVTQVARSGDTVLPGDTAPLSDVHWGALHGGRVLYVAARADGSPALVLHDLKTKTDRVLLRGGDAIPGHPGETFQYVAHQDWMDGSSVVFRAGSMDPYKTPNIRGSRQGLYGWFDVRWDDPAAFDPRRLVTLADTGTAMPGGSGVKEEARFADFRSAPVADGLTAFEALGTKNARGIYFSQHGAAPQVAVDNQSALPGLFEGEFQTFGVWPAAVEHGMVFTAQAKNFAGVFLYRVDQDALYLLADNRAPLEGKAITEFDIGSRPMVGDRFAVTVTFQDHTTGVYLATIPAQAFKRMETVASAN